MNQRKWTSLKVSPWLTTTSHNWQHQTFILVLTISLIMFASSWPRFLCTITKLGYWSLSQFRPPSWIWLSWTSDPLPRSPDCSFGFWVVVSIITARHPFSAFPRSPNTLTSLAPGAPSVAQSQTYGLVKGSAASLHCSSYWHSIEEIAPCHSSARNLQKLSVVFRTKSKPLGMELKWTSIIQSYALTICPCSVYAPVEWIFWKISKWFMLPYAWNRLTVPR